MKSRVAGKKVLITAGADFIGHNLALALKRLGGRAFRGISNGTKGFSRRGD